MKKIEITEKDSGSIEAKSTASDFTTIVFLLGTTLIAYAKEVGLDEAKLNEAMHMLWDEVYDVEVSE